MHDLIGDIYTSAVEPSTWPDALRRIAERTGADAAVLQLAEAGPHEPRVAAAWNVTAEVVGAFLRASSINPLITSGWFVNPGEPYTLASYQGEDAYRSSRFYAEVLAPHGYDDAILAVITRSASSLGMLVLPRRTGIGPAGREEMDTVRLLAPHLCRAIEIADVAAARGVREEMLAAALDLLVVGIVLVDEDLRIVHANRAGLCYVSDAQAVRRSDGCLSANDPRAAAALKDAVARVVRNAQPDLPEAGIPVPVAATDGRDLAAWVLPLAMLEPEWGAAAARSAKAAVFLRRIGEKPPVAGELLARRHGITPAEQRVLTMLMQGMSPLEAAEALGCSETTVRTHLQHLFLKTGTRGQLDLLRLATSAAAPGSL